MQTCADAAAPDRYPLVVSRKHERDNVDYQTPTAEFESRILRQGDSRRDKGKCLPDRTCSNPKSESCALSVR